MTTTLIRETPPATAAPAARLIRARLIDSGHGSSGYYPPATLEQAATDQIFHAGLHVYADHPTETEQADRPERSIRDIAGVLTTDATYDPATQALEATIRLTPAWEHLVTALAADIGLSIRAHAETSDTPQGLTIDRITHAESVDFVTRPGRGGKILTLLESARAAGALTPRPAHEEETPMPRTEPQPAQAAGAAPAAEATRESETIGARVKALEEALTEARAQAARERAARITAEAAARVTASGHAFTALERAALITGAATTSDGQLDTAALDAAIDEAAADAARTRATTGQSSGVTGFGAAPASDDLDEFDAAFTLRKDQL